MADAFARDLRKNMTDAERRLWSRLRGGQLGAKFRRQAPIGPDIVDFICLDRHLIIELNGGQHAVRTQDDEVRTAWLNLRGYRVLRFWNNLVFDELDPVLETIWLALQSPPHPTLPLEGGGDLTETTAQGQSPADTRSPRP